MNWEIILTITILIGCVISFAWEKISTDLTAIIAFALILLISSFPITSSFPSTTELFSVFSSSAPITIAAMFIVSAALEKCGLIESVASRFSKLTKYGYAFVLILMVVLVAILSAFINNTPVVVIFLPVVLSLARDLKVPASKLLIPLSYASIFGGSCTLVGTSTNILASDILAKAGFEPIRMFELSVIGGPMLLIAAVYLVFVGSRLLPIRETLTSILSDEERKEFLTEAYIRPGSPLDGTNVVESGILKGKSIRILEIIRDEVALKTDLKHTTLMAGDRLILSCRPRGFVHATSVEGLNILGDDSLGLETIAAHEGSIVEGIIGPNSSIAGRTIKDLNFRQRFRMVLIAIHRKGINLRDKIDTLPIEEGDTILMMGTDKAREDIRRGGDIILLDHPATPAQDMRKKQPIVIAVLIGLITAVSLGVTPISVASLVSMTVLFATGCIKPKDGYKAIDWSLLVLIYGMLAVGLAMQSTGASNLIANSLVSLSHLGIPENLRVITLLAATYLVANILTEFLSNNATVVIIAPIAIGLAQSLGIDPRAFVVATCIAASASFSTPIGYQTNTYVYGVGGYKFLDFFKVGLPLNILYFAGAMIIIPMFWTL